MIDAVSQFIKSLLDNRQLVVLQLKTTLKHDTMQMRFENMLAILTMRNVDGLRKFSKSEVNL